MNEIATTPAIINVQGIVPILQEVEKLTMKLNEAPNKDWLKKTPDGKADYIPVGIIENELRQDFAGLVQFEILSERRELNEYIVTARIKVFHPYIMQWMHYDGIGAAQIIQSRVPVLDADGNQPLDQYGKPLTRSAELSEFNDTKQKNALQLNAPKAFAEALKNAAKKIGVKYGAKLNRKSEESYEPEYTLEANMDEVIEKLQKCDNTDEVLMVWDTYPQLQTFNRFKTEFTKAKAKFKK